MFQLESLSVIEKLSSKPVSSGCSILTASRQHLVWSNVWILNIARVCLWQMTWFVLWWLKFIDFFAANVSIRGYFNNSNAPSTRGKLILCIRKMIRHGCQLLSVCMVARSRPSSCSLHDCWYEGLWSDFSLVKKRWHFWQYMYLVFNICNLLPLRRTTQWCWFIHGCPCRSNVVHWLLPIYGLLRLVRLRLATKLRRMI